MRPRDLAPAGGWAIGATPHPGWLELVIVDFRGRPLVHDTAPFDSPDPRVFAQSVEARLQAVAAAPGGLRLSWHRVVSFIPFNMIEMMQ